MTTNKRLDKQLHLYFKEVKKYLICDKETKKKFLKDFKNDVLAFICDNNCDNIEQIENNFGSPQDVAKSFLDNGDIEYLVKQLELKKSLTIGIIILVIIWIMALVYMFMH